MGSDKCPREILVFLTTPPGERTLLLLSYEGVSTSAFRNVVMIPFEFFRNVVMIPLNSNGIMTNFWKAEVDSPTYHSPGHSFRGHTFQTQLMPTFFRNFIIMVGVSRR